MSTEQEKVKLPEIVYQGDDRKLKERVLKFKEGTFRIVVFTVVGFIMGFFSHTYVTDSFVPIKLIMAVPYKLSEAIYVSLLGTDAASMRTEQWWLLNSFTEFFPHSGLATFLAESVTPVLLGGAIYGALAYFTGDKRVFTLQRFVKFGGCWCILILLFVGGAYGVNAKAVADNEALKGSPVFTLYDMEGDRMYISDRDKNALLEEYFYSELEPEEVQRDYDGEVYLGISFEPFRSTVCRINYRERYAVAEHGTTYRISAEFARAVQNYAENHILPEVSEEPEAEIQEETGHE